MMNYIFNILLSQPGAEFPDHERIRMLISVILGVQVLNPKYWIEFSFAIKDQFDFKIILCICMH